ncbi:hypothetical protein [Fervidibacillus albus]|uniref:Uncharacterized protein n=1 Tax=Fervidibacillus albus TaxID=2980026 RepID=A0A9E8LXQ0_9BACI|nr:hypothetical protein [Fervidibacillus albus]WAA10991.1 hypothetical protein OE104_06700 [Fervidibacillus albus]
MKKKVIWGVVLLFGFALITILYSQSLRANTDRAEENNEEQYTEAKVTVIEADYDLMENIQEVDQSSTLIVKGTFTGNRTLKEWVDEPTNTVVATASKSDVQVEKVLKGELENKTISVYEPAYFQDQRFISIEGYNLMEKGHDYVLFLRPMKDDETYVIVGMYQGKYDLDVSEPVKQLQNIQTYEDIKGVEYFGGNIDQFNELKSQVKKRYNLD